MAMGGEKVHVGSIEHTSNAKDEPCFISQYFRYQAKLIHDSLDSALPLLRMTCAVVTVISPERNKLANQ